MLAALENPIPAKQMALLACGIVAVLALYCLAYNGLQSQPVTFGDALAWPIANVVPMLVGLELARQRKSWPARSAILLASLAVALAIGAGLATHRYLIGFEAIRRLPVILGCIAILVLLDVVLRRRSNGKGLPIELPVPVETVDWVEAAANYVVLHGKGIRTIHRATLSQAEAALAPYGFLRIHRSRLVARRAIARVRTQDIILKDGSSLPTGARFRAGLGQLTPTN
jgi:DNA-binding LytR/AlgR family response regulator